MSEKCGHGIQIVKGCPLCEIDRLKARIAECESVLHIDKALVMAKDRDRYRDALWASVAIGHNPDCMFCGFKDKRATEALKEVDK